MQKEQRALLHTCLPTYISNRRSSLSRVSVGLTLQFLSKYVLSDDVCPVSVLEITDEPVLP